MKRILMITCLLGGTAFAADIPDPLVSGIDPYQQNAVVTGVLAQSSDCDVKEGRKRAQVWLSVGQVLLYQAEVPAGGSYEFHVVPGKYDLVATNEKGCLVQSQLSVTPKQVARMDLKLEPARGRPEVNRRPASQGAAR